MKEIEEFVDRITNFDSLSEGKDQWNLLKSQSRSQVMWNMKW
jgi:hypothetical protein